MRAHRRLLGIPALVFAAGCYAHVPVSSSALPAGATVALEINDAGRLALGGSMGPEIGQVEGRLVEQTNSSYVISVNAVRYLRGAGEQAWTGERITIPAEHVRAVSERRLSKGRTAIIAGAVVGAVAYAITRGIIGSGDDGPERTPGDTAQSVRIPR